MAVTDFAAVAFVMVALWGARPVRPLSAFNDDYLCVKQTKSLRGIFALMVLVHHLSQKVECGPLLGIFPQMGHLPVAVFFFVSGYGLQKSYMTRKGYCRAFLPGRLPAVLLPYVMMTVVYVLVLHMEGQPPTAKEVLASFVTPRIIVIYAWYLNCILGFYIVFWVLMLLCRQRHTLMPLCGCVWYVLYTVWCMRTGSGSWWYNAAHLLVVGMAWATREKSILAFVKPRFWLVAAAVWTAFWLLFAFPQTGQVLRRLTGFGVMRGTLLAMLFVVGLITVLLKCRIGNRVTEWLGSMSLEMYLVQGLFVTRLRGSWCYIQNDLLWMAAVLCASVLCAAALHLLVTKLLNGYRRLLKTA